MSGKQAVYMGIDPGGKTKKKGKETTGWATADADGNIIEMGQVSMENFTEFFTEHITSDIKHVVIEEYENFVWANPHRRSNQTNNQTSKHIGKLEMLCEMRGVPYTRQRNVYMSTGLLWAGLGALPSNHDISHQYSAVGHLVYWLQENGIREPGRSIPKELR